MGPCGGQEESCRVLDYLKLGQKFRADPNQEAVTVVKAVGN